MRVTGIAHPKGHDDKYLDFGFRASEMPSLAKKYTGRPVRLEHCDEDVGRIDRAHVVNDCLVVDFMLDKTPGGQEAARRIRSGEMKALSAGFDTRLNKEGTAVKEITPVEVSICREPDKPGSHIIAFGENQDGAWRTYKNPLLEHGNKGIMEAPAAPPSNEMQELMKAAGVTDAKDFKALMDRVKAEKDRLEAEKKVLEEKEQARTQAEFAVARQGLEKQLTEPGSAGREVLFDYVANEGASKEAMGMALNSLFEEPTGPLVPLVRAFASSAAVAKGRASDLTKQLEQARAEIAETKKQNEEMKAQMSKQVTPGERGRSYIDMFQKRPVQEELATNLAAWNQAPPVVRAQASAAAASAAPAEAPKWDIAGFRTALEQMPVGQYSKMYRMGA
jgi:hypothetical protein